MYQCLFTKNVVSSGKAKAVGPVMGLSSGVENSDADVGSSALFFNCSFGPSTASVPGHNVSVENELCRVYSNTREPLVFDIERDIIVRPWYIASSSESGDDVFEGRMFPTESDNWFTEVVQVRLIVRNHKFYHVIIGFIRIVAFLSRIMVLIRLVPCVRAKRWNDVAMMDIFMILLEDAQL
jgi:hypothetical protein